MFVDDIKSYGIVDSEKSYLNIQRDQDQLGQWAEDYSD